MKQSANNFFIEYQRANSSSDIAAIAALYADTFMFAGIGGSQAITKADFVKVIPKRKAYFSAMGLSEATLKSVEAVPISTHYLLATVAWRFTLHHSPHAREVEALSTYILARSGIDVLSIVLQIDHQDLASLVREQPTT